MPPDYSPMFTYGSYGMPGYDKLFDYGPQMSDFSTPGGGWMPGMTSQSPSYGNPNSLSYTSPGPAGNKLGWKNLSALDKMSAIGEGVQAFATLAQLYTGFKGLQQQREQFKFAKGAWTKNFAAQLGAYDNQVRDNYQKYKQGNSYFGNDYQSEEDYIKARSLSHLA